jgi:YgiT-type zinc finger domain-containing protein
MKQPLTIKTCPNCNSDRIAKVCRDWTGKYRNQQYTVPELEFYECPVCGERVFDVEAVRKIREYSPAYGKRQKTRRKGATIEAIPVQTSSVL